jgi:Arc/MetJ-type ribon-helix-helix transcriptional regulator
LNSGVGTTAENVRIFDGTSDRLSAPVEFPAGGDVDAAYWLEPVSFLWHVPPMASRSVQISLEEGLLAEVDRHPEAQRRGRSALIRRALRFYLDAQRRREIDAAYQRAYEGKADEVFDEFADLMDAQAWPER